MATLDAVLGVVGRQVAPVVGSVDQTARSTVDASLALVTEVTDVVAAVPTVGEPVAQVADGVIDLARGLPPVGVPSPIVPLPAGGATSTPVGELPGNPAVLANGQVPTVSTGAELLGTGSGGSRWVLPDASAHPTHGQSARATAVPTLGGNGAPGGPWTLLDTSPAVPAQPSPTGGGVAQTSGDPATTTPDLILPNPSFFGRTGADWRVPRGLPAHPGTRPD